MKNTQGCKNERKDSFWVQDITNIVVSLDRINRIPFVIPNKEISDYLGIHTRTVKSLVFTYRTYVK